MYTCMARLKILPNLKIVQSRLPSPRIVLKSYVTLLTSISSSSRPAFIGIKQKFPKILVYISFQPKTTNTNNVENVNKSNFENIINRLEGFYQLNGFLCKEQLHPLIEYINQAAGTCLTEEFCVFLLTTSGCEMPSITPNERIFYFQQIWQYLQRNNLLNKDHYIAMLQVLQYNRSPLKDYQKFLNEYVQAGGQRSDIFSDLLALAGHSGDVKLATDLLAEMRTLQVPLNERDFNSLLMAYGRSGDLNGCHSVKDTMLATSVSITTETQSTMVAIYLENDVQEKGLSLLKQYEGQFETKQVLKMLQSLVKCENISVELINSLIQAFKSDYLQGIEVPIALRRICVELLHNDKLDFVQYVMDSLPQPRFTENQDIDTFGVFLLHALFRNNCPIKEIIKVASALERSGKNTRALYVAAELALKRYPPDVLPIFQVLSERGQQLKPHYFWPLIIYKFRRNGEAGILHTLNIMRDFKVECDTATLWEYILPKLSITLTNPELALQKFKEAGIKTSVALVPVITHLLNQHKWLDVTPLVEKYPTKINTNELITTLCSIAIHARATKRYYQFARLLAALAAKSLDTKEDFIGLLLVELLTTQVRFRNDHYVCLRLLSEMKKLGLNISASAADIIQIQLQQSQSTGNTNKTKRLPIIQQQLKELTVKGLILSNAANSDNENGNNKNTSSSSFIKHPRDMSLDELECHLIELEAKGLNTRGVLRRLLQLYVRDNRLDRAVEVKRKCDELQVQISPGMLASIVEMYVKLKDLPKAEQNLQKLQRNYPGFLIDEHKFVDYAALLVNCQQLDTAKKHLRERSENNRIAGGDYLLKNIWNLLTNVARLAAKIKDLDAERNLTREMFTFLQKLGYCRPHNTILGPIVRERLLRGDLPGAIMEFKQLSESYKHTPLQFEMLSLLVRLGNGNDELLQQYNCTKEQAQQFLGELTHIISSIHGEVNMNSGLLLAFAESGSDNQLRRLFINPEFRINEELLLRNCEYLGQEGAVQTLLRLARSSRGLNRVINEHNIYKMLLNNFVKINDYVAALNLFERLEEDDELKISTDFIQTLVNLLKVNNVEMPKNIALRAFVL